MKYPTALLLTLTFIALAPHTATARQAEFRAWTASCSASACAATTATPGGRVILRFSRRNDPQADWQISFSGFEQDLRPGSPLGISVDYGPFRPFGPGRGYRLEPGRVVIAGLTRSSPLFSALLRGRRATVEFQHREGFAIPLDFSLSGLTASLLWIDEQQGRTGAPPSAALQGQPEQTIPPQTPPVPKQPEPRDTTDRTAIEKTPPAATQAEDKPLPSGVPAQVEKKHLADGDCVDYRAKHMVESRIIDRLDANNILYALPCYTGAYNVIYRIYVHDSRYPEDVKRESFAGYSDERGWYGRDELINVSYDKKTKVLSAFEKSRGLGDCGSTLSLRWITGSFWRLEEYRYWRKCDGSHLPESWPVVYKHPDAAKKE